MFIRQCRLFWAEKQPDFIKQKTEIKGTNEGNFMAKENNKQNNQQQERIERGYKIRQVTQIQPSWKEGGRGEEGEFFIQLVLDNGVDEYIIQPSSSDVDVILEMFEKSKYTVWDDERQILIFENIPTK